ncbi:acetylornithine carbamoyltransferase [Flavobacteriaceae bacterium]|nr:acetylornithine carbamoyltransferase [Flavobacteriaceae bacterium]MDB2632274.1 acetylornithine carbamoyltransferase [Flavobacteriaceae bacterium]
MTHFLNINNISDLNKIVEEAIVLKANPFMFQTLGAQKTLVLLFFNASLRTRISTELAAKNLGMNVIVLNVSDAWQLEFEDGIVMNLHTSEHIKEAAQVISQYASIIGVRAFPSLSDKAKDQSEWVLNAFSNLASVPVINMESATAHPLQALADAITIAEHRQSQTPKVVLSWAPHPKALPHAVANSFVRMMQLQDVEFCITHPKGYDLDPNIIKDTPVFYDQEKALQNADFVYVKNWSSFNNYGKILTPKTNWMMTQQKIGHAKFMHCLPVRRNVVVEDAILDSVQSLCIEQSNNRTYAAQIVLKKMLESL